MIGVRKDLRNRIIINHRTDLIYHLYFILLKIRKLNLQSKKSRKKCE